MRSQLQDHIRRVREAVPEAAANWSRPENIHLTLKFFGNVAQDQVQGISAAAARATDGHLPFQIGLGGAGVFPKPSQARVLWIGVNDLSGKLKDLQQRLDSECEIEGFSREDRAFRPHLTIARVRRPSGARRLAEAHLRTDFSFVEVALTELTVFRSELSSHGSRYTAISHHLMSDRL